MIAWVATQRLAARLCIPEAPARPGRASYRERIQMRRERVLLTLWREPGLTAREVGAEMEEDTWGPIMHDLKVLESRGLVKRITVAHNLVRWVRA